LISTRRNNSKINKILKNKIKFDQVPYETQSRMVLHQANKHRFKDTLIWQKTQMDKGKGNVISMATSTK
jgi:hypothetical protein